MPPRRLTGTRITCVVADEQPARAEAISELLAAHGIEVVARASDVVTALELIDAHGPTVAVLDLALQRLDGIEVARLARLRNPETATIIHTEAGEQELELLAGAVDAGIRGFVHREADPGRLIRAIELAAAGESYVDPVLAPALVRASVTHPAVKLSQRERDILRLLADGKTNDEIGTELHISGHTVRTYLRRAMTKLEADNRTQAVATALRESFIT
jgi:DNA-binding NarL/FixJ family response regulator